MQTIEKRYEHNINLHILFINIQQAFDTVNKLLTEIVNMDIPSKLTKQNSNGEFASESHNK